MTSGLIVFAKKTIILTPVFQNNLKKKTEREYNLLVWNLLPKSEGSIDKNISRSKFNRKKCRFVILIMEKKLLQNIH